MPRIIWIRRAQDLLSQIPRILRNGLCFLEPPTLELPERARWKRSAAAKCLFQYHRCIIHCYLSWSARLYIRRCETWPVVGFRDHRNHETRLCSTEFTGRPRIYEMESLLHRTSLLKLPGRKPDYRKIRTQPEFFQNPYSTIVDTLILVVSC